MTANRFFLVLAAVFGFWATGHAAPVVGKTYALKFTDVDGRSLSTSDGVATVLVLASRAELNRVREVGDRIPERCLGNPGSRMVTVVRFGKRTSAMRFVLTSLVRHGLDTEARRMKPRYIAKGLTRDPRPDMYAVADFDGDLAAKLGLEAGAMEFRVIILSGTGTLLREWTSVPSAQQLAAAVP